MAVFRFIAGAFGIIFQIIKAIVTEINFVIRPKSGGFLFLFA